MGDVVGDAPCVIAIDGPAGSGKGTLARALAVHLGYAYLDSGLLYRAVADQILQCNGDPDDLATAVSVAGRLKKNDLESPRLRDEDVARVASRVAAIEEVRTALLDYQHAFARSPCLADGRPAPGVVIDGRDIGSVVFPDAVAKFYVTASLEVRAERRLKELRNRGSKSIRARVLRQMRERDHRDRDRAVSPLVCASDAFEIETTGLTPQEVLGTALQHLAVLGVILR